MQLTISQSTGDRILNLAEIEFYNNDVKIGTSYLSFATSSIDALYPLSNIYDENINTFYHTNENPLDPNPTLTITVAIGVIFDTIILTNRQDACCEARLNGAILKIFEQGSPNNVRYFIT